MIPRVQGKPPPDITYEGILKILEGTVTGALICKHAGRDCDGEPTWVVAYQCDRCDADGTGEYCNYHYTRYQQYAQKKLILGCGDCHGTLSFVSRSLLNGSEESKIN